MLATLQCYAAPPTRQGDAACPPSCANNPMAELLDKYCSDKGTFWQSKHHYGTAYHSIFGSLRGTIRSLLEVGIGEDTSPSAATWLEYFPKAQIYLVDIKSTKEVQERARPGGHTDGVAKHQAKFGCEYNRSMWTNPRMHLFLDTDASQPEQLKKLELPDLLDVIIDDGSHRYLDQEKTLQTLWPRLRAGGFYVIEDVLVGALPWDASHAKQVPTINDNCGLECFFPQRLAEHPFMFDRFKHLKNYQIDGKVRTPLTERSTEIFRNHDWWWAVTGVHQGGGLDTTLVIRKRGPEMGIVAPLPGPSSDSTSDAGDGRALQQAQRSLALAESQMAEMKARQKQMADALLRAERLGREGTTDARVSSERSGSNLPWFLLLISLAAHGYQMRKRRGAAKVPPK